MKDMSTELVKATTTEITAIETRADRGTQDHDSELAFLAPAAAAALGLLADAIKKGATNREDVVQALKESAVHERFADVLEAASDDVMTGAEDPYDFDIRMDADNLSAAASNVRKLFYWL